MLRTALVASFAALALAADPISVRGIEFAQCDLAGKTGGNRSDPGGDARGELGVRALLQLLAAGNAGLQHVGIVQRAFFDPAHPLVYGFWRPRDGGNPFGPFVNRNHFAGWMVMVLPVVAMYAVGVFYDATRTTARGAAVWRRRLQTGKGATTQLAAAGAS